ncbi:unnamed protein product [Zymoseptoria tritici ST99CH_3D7]|uniref:Uncharacterized protein n=1 Tax=Zymoseptoria tritici (strain ST99CH_3D7) TaxID=1276538 RepID=A0A1X7RMJ9_ZYMT9|nr:unnamed protein product [Zymoseptoria tritici ST99CH_3D7]
MKLSARPPRPVWKRNLLDGRLQALAIIAIAISLTVFLARSAINGTESGSFQCAPDGSLLLPDQTVAPAWEAKYFFSITIAWGRFDLSTAKLIDIAWDIIVGRGGQLGLSLMAFRTIRRSMLSSLEHEPCHIPVLTRLVLDPVSFLVLWAAMKDRCRRGPRMLLNYGFLVVYILLFSTISSAMTGYRAVMSPYYPQDEGSALPLVDSKLTQIFPLELMNVTRKPSNGTCWVRTTPENGCFSKEFPNCVVPPVGECYASWLLYSDLYTQCTDLPRSEHGRWGGTYSTLPPPRDSPICGFLGPQPLGGCNHNGPIPETSGTCNTTRPSSSGGDETSISIGWTAYSNNTYYLTTTNLTHGDPTTTYRLPPQPPLLCTWNITDYNSPLSPGFTSPRFYNDTQTGQVWNSNWLRANVICQPEKTYQWGFSSLLLFTLLIYTIVYGVVLLLMVWDNACSELVGKSGWTECVYRDILDLAGEIRSEVGGDDVVEDMDGEVLGKRMRTTTGKVRLRAKREGKDVDEDQEVEFLGGRAEGGRFA